MDLTLSSSMEEEAGLLAPAGESSMPVSLSPQLEWCQTHHDSGYLNEENQNVQSSLAEAEAVAAAAMGASPQREAAIKVRF